MGRYVPVAFRLHLLPVPFTLHVYVFTFITSLCVTLLISLFTGYLLRYVLRDDFIYHYLHAYHLPYVVLPIHVCYATFVRFAFAWWLTFHHAFLLFCRYSLRSYACAHTVTHYWVTDPFAYAVHVVTAFPDYVYRLPTIPHRYCHTAIRC